jgi:hypothetical protein
MKSTNGGVWDSDNCYHNHKITITQQDNVQTRQIQWFCLITRGFLIVVDCVVDAEFQKEATHSKKRKRLKVREREE